MNQCSSLGRDKIQQQTPPRDYHASVNLRLAVSCSIMKTKEWRSVKGHWASLRLAYAYYCSAPLTVDPVNLHLIGSWHCPATAAYTVEIVTDWLYERWVGKGPTATARAERQVEVFISYATFRFQILGQGNSGHQSPWVLR